MLRDETDYTLSRAALKFHAIIKLQLALFKSPKYEEQPVPPLASTCLSLVFLLGLAAIVTLYSTEILRCSLVANQIGCQTMNSAADCDNLLTATCTSKCSQTPYTYCSDWQKTTTWVGRPYPEGDAACDDVVLVTAWNLANPNLYNEDVLTSTSPIADPSSRTWSSLPPPSDSLTCKAFFEKWQAIATPAIQGLVLPIFSGTYLNEPNILNCEKLARSYLTPPTGCPTGYPAPCDKLKGEEICCAKQHVLTNEALGQCCGVLKSSKLCLSSGSTVGVVGGYVSLWYSLCQLFFTIAGYLYLRRAADKKGDDSGGTIEIPVDGEFEMVSEAETVGGAPQNWRDEFSIIRKDIGTLTARFDRQAAELEEGKKRAQREAEERRRDDKQPRAQTGSAWSLGLI